MYTRTPPAPLPITPATASHRDRLFSPTAAAVEYGQPPILLSQHAKATDKGRFGFRANDDEQLEAQFIRKTKIVCTMGPKCSDVDTIVRMIDAGMNVARLNFSHGDYDDHLQVIQNVREAAKKRADKRVAIMMDTKGKEQIHIV